MQSRNSRGFTFIEVVIALGIAGILAAVALPWYRDYTVRSRVAELVNAAANCKTLVAEYYAINGRLPGSARQAGCNDSVTANANPLAVFQGEVIVQAVGGLAAQLGARNIFAFRAVCTDGKCEGGAIKAWSCAPSGNERSSTTIATKYLPSTCR
jgi:type IV pilus assembly protein PilA